MEGPLSNFVSAGFLVTRAVDRPPGSETDLSPARTVSASPCIAPFLPGTWCIEWTGDTREQRIDDAAAFGLDSGALDELILWATPRIDRSLRWPNVIFDLDTATELTGRFLPSLADVRVLELALHRSMTDGFCRKAEPPPARPGFARNGRQGIHEMILERRAPVDGGRVLGFEPLVFNHSLSCSWLCNGLDAEIHRALGIRPNRHGLIETFDQARRSIEHISRDDVGAEPGLWLPWLIVDHTLAETAG